MPPEQVWVGPQESGADSADQGPIDRLVERARRGDPDALTALYRRFAVRVYRFCLARVGRAADAEDLMQVTLLKVTEGLPSYETRGLPFAAWVFRIARNAVIDFERTDRDRRVPHVLGEPHDPNATPDEVAEQTAERNSLAVALRSLTPEQREVISLRFFAGLSASEIGHLMGKREPAVRALQWRALKAMHSRLSTNETSAFALPGRAANR